MIGGIDLRQLESAENSKGLHTAPKLEGDDENGLAIRVKHDEQVRQLYGLTTNEAANLLLEMALQAFGTKAMSYTELMPAMAVEIESLRMLLKLCWSRR
jgi:hypothetical protein